MKMGYVCGEGCKITGEGKYAKTIMEEEYAIAEFVGGLGKGDYAFPFSFGIDKGVPGTLNSHNSISAEITHQIEVWL